MSAPAPAAPPALSITTEIEELKKLLTFEASKSIDSPSPIDGLTNLQRYILSAIQLIADSQPAWIPAAAIAGTVCAEFDASISSDTAYLQILAMCRTSEFPHPLLQSSIPVGDGHKRGFRPRISDVSVKVSPWALPFMDAVPPVFERQSYRGKLIPTRLNPSFPTLVINGCTSGKSTNIPPHNLDEICTALLFLCNRTDADPSELLGIIQGPDFPHRCGVKSMSTVSQYFRTGKAGLLARGDVTAEPLTEDRSRLVIESLPPGVTPEQFLEDLADKLKAFPEIVDYRNESGTEVRVLLDLRKNTDTKSFIARLCEGTLLEIKLKVSGEITEGGKRHFSPFASLLSDYIHKCREWHIEVLKAELEELAPEGSTVAELEELDDEDKKRVDELRSQIEDPVYINSLLVIQLEEIKRAWSKPRTTTILQDDTTTADDACVADIPCAVILTKMGFAKRTPAHEWREQRRGGKGVAGIQTTEGLDDTAAADQVITTFVANAHDQILFLTNLGRAYQRKVHHIPETARNDTGEALASMLALGAGEVVVEAITYRNPQADASVMIATAKGLVKKIALSSYTTLRDAGKIIIELADDDKIVAAEVVCPGDDVMLVSKGGMSIRFAEADARLISSGKSKGVCGMKVSGEDAVIAMTIPLAGASVLVIGQTGLGKRTPFEEYGRQGRAGRGIATMKTGDRTGTLVAALCVYDVDSVLFVSTRGQSLRTAAGQISTSGRNTSGSELMKVDFDGGEHVQSAAVIPGERPERVAAAAAADPEPVGDTELPAAPDTDEAAATADTTPAEVAPVVPANPEIAPEPPAPAVAEAVVDPAPPPAAESPAPA